MMHFFRSSKIHLDCFTDSSSVIETAPIDNAIKYIPNWWRKLPNSFYAGDSFFKSPTMKSCIGMYEYYAKSVCIPMWSELAVRVNEGKVHEWQFSDRVSEAEVHSKAQFAGFDLRDAGHLKLIAPWLFKEKTGVSWLMSQPTYSMGSIDDYTLLPGMLEFKYQNGVNTQLMINLSSPRVFNIDFRTPLALLTPLTDKRVEVHRHLITPAELVKITGKHLPRTFIKKYKTFKNAVSNKCPFHDHTGVAK